MQFYMPEPSTFAVAHRDRRVTTRHATTGSSQDPLELALKIPGIPPGFAVFSEGLASFSGEGIPFFFEPSTGVLHIRSAPHHSC